jgi:hypothetical protein
VYMSVWDDEDENAIESYVAASGKHYIIYWCISENIRIFFVYSIFSFVCQWMT